MDTKMKIAVTGTVLVLCIAAVLIYINISAAYKESENKIDVTEYYAVPEGEAILILNDEYYKENCVIEEGVPYIGRELLKQLAYRFYEDSNEKLLIYTTPTEIIKIPEGKSEYTVNGTKVATDYVIWHYEADDLRVALDFVEKYADIKIETFSNPDRIIITNEWVDYLYSDVVKDTKMRVSYDIKSDILLELPEGEKLLYVDSGGIQANGFVQVMTMQGIQGYVQSKYLSESYYETRVSEKVMPEYTQLKKDYDINLTWHYIGSLGTNDLLEKMLADTEGINTISPTWFKITDNEGNISSFAEKEYVELAHSKGIEVWALIDDFESSVDMYELLSHTGRREHLIEVLMSEVESCDIDGINIDFERIRLDAGPHYVQFIRELSAVCRSKGIVLSVDTTPPTSYSAYYDRTEQGKVIDYLIIMAYDEHYSGSSEAGSVSSIGFVQNAVDEALKQVPAERLIIGIPFYTRLWKQTSDGGLTSEAMGMANMHQYIKENDISYRWDDITAQFYAEFEKDNIKHKMWMEDEFSIEEKLKVITSAEVAGIATWRLGFEKSTIWETIKRYIN